MDNPEEKQKIIDDEHLKLLSLFHYISGGLTLAFVLFFGAYFLFIYFIITGAGFQQEINPAMNTPIPEAILAILLTVMIIIFILGLLFGVAQIVSGRFMNLRKMRWFSFTVGILNLLSIPYGTILGIFTLTVLGRYSITQQYSETNV